MHRDAQRHDAQALADLVPAAGLERLQEWLNFVSSEIHGGLGVLFNTSIPEEVKLLFKATLFKRFAILVQTLERQDYLLGEQLSVADAYLLVVLRWAAFFDIDLQKWPALAGSGQAGPTKKSASSCSVQ